MNDGKTLTLLELALLGLTHQSPQSGYDLRKTFAGTAIGHYSSSPGAIYPALKRLQLRGLLSSSVDSTTRLRPKRLFRPTAKGLAILKAWVNTPLTSEAVTSDSRGVMLRFAFMGALASPAVTRRFLTIFHRASADYAKELERQLASMPTDGPLQPRLAVMRGIENYKADARWARKSLVEYSRFKPRKKRTR
jgi:DNA-binding PadR family transcriptional regulator